MSFPISWTSGNAMVAMLATLNMWPLWHQVTKSILPCAVNRLIIQMQSVNWVQSLDPSYLDHTYRSKSSMWAARWPFLSQGWPTITRKKPFNLTWTHVGPFGPLSVMLAVGPLIIFDIHGTFSKNSSETQSCLQAWCVLTGLTLQVLQVRHSNLIRSHRSYFTGCFFFV